MRKLANISAFEALASGYHPDANITSVFGIAKTENGRLSNYIGTKLADKFLFGDGVNKKNYEAAVKKGKEEAERFNKNWYGPIDTVGLERGFELFGKFCAGIDLDLSDIINSIEVVYDPDAERASASDDGLIRIPLKTDKDDPEYGVTNSGDVAHELAHQLYRHPVIGRALKSKAKFPGRMTEMFDDAVYQRDRLRSWVAGDWYAGKDYPTQTDDEYLPMLLSEYHDKRIPLLYALDIKRLINKINKAGKQKGKKNR